MNEFQHKIAVLNDIITLTKNLYNSGAIYDIGRNCEFTCTFHNNELNSDVNVEYFIDSHYVMTILLAGHIPNIVRFGSFNRAFVYRYSDIFLYQDGTEHKKFDLYISSTELEQKLFQLGTIVNDDILLGVELAWNIINYAPNFTPFTLHNISNALPKIDLVLKHLRVIEKCSELSMK